jgi:hypothetical protein
MRKIWAFRASHSRAASWTMASNIGRRSVDESPISRRIALVAACCFQ